MVIITWPKVFLALYPRKLYILKETKGGRVITSLFIASTTIVAIRFEYFLNASFLFKMDTEFIVELDKRTEINSVSLYSVLNGA